MGCRHSGGEQLVVLRHAGGRASRAVGPPPEAFDLVGQAGQVDICDVPGSFGRRSGESQFRGQPLIRLLLDGEVGQGLEGAGQFPVGRRPAAQASRLDRIVSSRCAVDGQSRFRRRAPGLQRDHGAPGRAAAAAGPTRLGGQLERGGRGGGRRCSPLGGGQAGPGSSKLGSSLVEFGQPPRDLGPSLLAQMQVPGVAQGGSGLLPVPAALHGNRPSQHHALGQVVDQPTDPGRIGALGALGQPGGFDHAGRVGVDLLLQDGQPGVRVPPKPGEPFLDVAEPAGVEQSLEQVFAIRGVGAQEPGEVALGQQHDLEELIGGHAEQIPDRLADVVGAGQVGRRPARPGRVRPSEAAPGAVRRSDRVHWPWAAGTQGCG